LENRPTHQEMTKELKSKLTKDELNNEFSKKASLEDVKTLIENDLSKIELKREYSNLKSDINENHEYIKRITSDYASKLDIEKLNNHLDMYVKHTEFTEQLNLKATKQSVNNALNRKINTSDLDILLLNKADNTIVDELNNSISNMVSINHFETQFAKVWEYKIHRQEINNVKEMLQSKIDLYKYEELIKDYSSFKKQTEDELNLQRDKSKQGLINVNTSLQSILTDLNKRFQDSELDCAKDKLVDMEQNINKLSVEIHELNNEMKNNKINQIDPYASVDEVREALIEMRNDFSANLVELKGS